MKKVLFIGLATMLLSCKVFYGTDAKFTMGMTESDFKEANKPNLVSAAENGEHIYRTYYHLTERYKFFLFRDGKLVRFEEGTRPDDYQLLKY